MERAMQETQPRLWRSSRNKVIAGVCGGLAERFGMDPTLMRVIFVIVSVASAAFPGTIVYLLLWALTSERDVGPRV
jgi:phage shock protein PspC (stress-responsive transcriptional regulator)